MSVRKIEQMMPVEIICFLNNWDFTVHFPIITHVRVDGLEMSLMNRNISYYVHRIHACFET